MSFISRIQPRRITALNPSRQQLTRSFAQSQQPSRRPGSLISQQTAKEWKDLTNPQKVVAASKATFNIGLLLTGATLTVGLVYFVTSELFSSQSSTSIFSEAVDRAKANEDLVRVLGEPIKSYGSPSRNRMRRNRRINYQVVDDHLGQPHLFMKFYLEGSDNEGTGMLEMIKDEKNKWEFKKLVVDVPGQGLPSQRFVLV
ncbi:TIM21-domain-containing protein [Phycomyces nitens]|nr:TIM21-domain-containing protein [Phycomyces nitens]